MTPNSPQIMKYFLILFAFVCTCVGMSAQVTTAEIEKLKKEQSSLKSKIAENEKLLRAAKSDINSQLNSVMLIDAQVKEQKLYVSKIEKEVKALKAEIKLLEKEFSALLADLAHCKAQYQKALLETLRGMSNKEPLVAYYRSFYKEECFSFSNRQCLPEECRDALYQIEMGK